MALPKIQSPIFNTDLPSSGQNIKYRPFTVKEEKLLLIAREGNDTKDAFNAVKQIVNNCVLDDIDVENMPTIDIEWLFLSLRAKSVNNIIKLRFQDKEDEQIYSVDLNIDDVKVEKWSGDNKIQLTDDVGVILKLPTLNSVLKANSDNANEQAIDILKGCIESIYDKTAVYPIVDADPKELDEFIESLSSEQFQKLNEFFTNVPKLKHTVSYTREDGEVKSIELQGLNDFFTFA